MGAGCSVDRWGLVAEGGVSPAVLVGQLHAVPPCAVRDRAAGRAGDAGPDVSSPDAPLLLRVAEAARLLGVSRSTMYELIGSGQVPVGRIGRSMATKCKALGKGDNRGAG